MSHYVFHPHHDPVVVPTSEYQKYLDDGWYDTPLKFPKSDSQAGLAEVPASPKKAGRPPKSKSESEKVSEDDQSPLVSA